MTDTVQGPAPRPCESCPYRRDVPSGVWAPEEYAKLPAYDNDTHAQPPGLFLCHQQNGRVCAGWAGCHDGENLLGLRLATAARALEPAAAQATIDYVSPVPLWPSGRAAAAHGMAEIAAPGVEAARVMAKVTRRQDARELTERI